MNERAIAAAATAYAEHMLGSREPHGHPSDHDHLNALRAALAAAERVAGEDARELEHLIATELKERHCTSLDGTVVHAPIKVVVHSVLAALALSPGKVREDS